MTSHLKSTVVHRKNHRAALLISKAARCSNGAAEID
jgi:hypothetical protein